MVNSSDERQCKQVMLKFINDRIKEPGVRSSHALKTYTKVLVATSKNKAEWEKNGKKKN